MGELSWYLLLLCQSRIWFSDDLLLREKGPFMFQKITHLIYKKIFWNRQFIKAKYTMENSCPPIILRIYHMIQIANGIIIRVIIIVILCSKISLDRMVCHICYYYTQLLLCIYINLLIDLKFISSFPLWYQERDNHVSFLIFTGPSPC